MRILKGIFLLLLGDNFTICANIETLWDYFKVQPRCQLLLLTLQLLCLLIRLFYSLLQPFVELTKKNPAMEKHE